MQYITTSWDDGHALDFKLAEGLHKFGLKGTFYIPKANAERTVMTEAQVQELSRVFEIGGHTLNHIRLKGLDKQVIKEEVSGCHNWLSDVTGQAPVSFCFPGGAFDAQSLAEVFDSGFNLARTTELLSLKQSPISATTIQVYPHTGGTYFKHLVKRRRWQSLVGWLKNNCAVDLIRLTEKYLKSLHATGGCFHLWGHSWEIEENNLWTKLETLFAILSNHPEAQFVTNKDVLVEEVSYLDNTHSLTLSTPSNQAC